MKNLILYNNNDFYHSILNYIYDKYDHKINDFEYLCESIQKSYSYRDRLEKIEMCIPCDTKFSFIYEKDNECYELDFELETIYQSNKNFQKIIQSIGCNNFEEVLLKRITLSNENKSILIKFVNETKKYSENKIELNKLSNEKTIKVNYWRKEYWNLLSKNPKRKIDTLYLKSGQKEKLLNVVSEFYDEKTKNDYDKFGIPYKSVILLYGVPGSGKTSTINTIASHFDCDIYTIPISKELTDYGLIEAMSFLEEKEDKKRIIVIEDIDSIFAERKKNDELNGITLQGLLNCFDGFSCLEGTLLFITANNPSVLDYAMLRSCRIDHKFHLDYADEYQTKCIFETIFEEKKELFQKFYNLISYKKYTTAMLQEFLFFNRKYENLITDKIKINEFYEIIDKNTPQNFEENKKELYL